MPTAVPPEEYTRYIKYYYNEKHVNLSLNLFFLNIPSFLENMIYYITDFFAGC